MNEAPEHYKTHLTEEMVGSLKFQVRALASLDESAAATYRALADARRTEEYAELCPYFGIVWPAARVLAQYITTTLSQENLAGKTMLELGCGLGLPGMTAAQLGAQVTLTDFHPHAAAFIED